jgi:hypothetical protein
MCLSSKDRIIYYKVQISKNDIYCYNFDISGLQNFDEEPSLYLKSFVSSKIRNKLYYKHKYNIRPFWYFWFNNTYYFEQENCYIKLYYYYY